MALESSSAADALLGEDSVQHQFSGYYYDGKAAPEATKQIEAIMIGGKTNAPGSST